MKLTTLELASIVSGKLIGDKDVVLTGVGSLSMAKRNEISFLGNLKYAADAAKTQAGVIFVANDTDISQFKDKNVIKVSNPQYAYALVLAIVEKEKSCDIERKVHTSASIANSAKVGKNSYIGQNVVIEDMSEIGDNARLFPNVYIGKGVKIGKDCLIYPNVVIREGSVIGDRVILHPGVVVGGDGFGFTAVDGKAWKIPQIGTVEIGDDVEIGSNTVVDRATTGVTRIGNDTKIDNLVQIAHNVQIGENCIIVAQVGISGSTRLGNNVTIAGQTGLSGHLKIGNNVTIGSQAGITGNIEDNKQVGGNPMTSLRRSIKIRALIRKLPEMYMDLKKIKKNVKDNQII